MKRSAFSEEAFRQGLVRHAPRLDAMRVIGAFTPSAWSVTVALLALATMLPASAFAAFLLLIAPDGIDSGDLLMALSIFGAFGVPPAAVGLAGSAGVAGRMGARAVLLGAAAGLLLVGGASCGVGAEISSEATMGTGFLWGALPWALAGGVLGLLAGVLLALTPRALSSEVDRQRQRRAIDLLMMGGSLDLSDLVRGLGTDEAGARDILDRLERSGTLTTRIDEDLGRVATAERVGRRHALLLAEVERRGSAGIDALSHVVREPGAMVRRWLDELIEAGTLDAAIEDGTVTFKALKPFEPCAGCGGPIAAVGGAMGRCVHCGNEAWSR